jgi:uncharacterized protein YycO
MTTYEPRIGDYGVVKTKGWLGLFIRLGTMSRWNHAFIYIGDGQIIEANPRGVQIQPLHYPKVAWNRHDELTDAQRAKIVELAHKTVGRNYSFLTIFLIVLRILGVKLLANLKLLRNMAEKDGYICSELVAECYTDAGFPVLAKPDYQVVPGDLAERLLYL